MVALGVLLVHCISFEYAQKMLKGEFAPPALSTLSQFELSSVLGGPGAQAVRACCRGRHGVVGVSGMGKESRALGLIQVTLSPGGNPRHSDQSLVGAGPLEGSWRP